MTRRIASFLVLSMGILASSELRAQADRACAVDTVEDLRRSERDPVDPIAAGTGAPVLRIVMTIGGLAVLSCAAYFLWRRSGAGSRALGGSRAVEVIGRTTLSSRHAVSVLRFGDRLILVGLSGERMRTLATLEDPREIEDVLRRVEGGREARTRQNDAIDPSGGDA